MTYEVEQKFAVRDQAQIRSELESLGAVFTDTIRQVDTYYAHPCRDFAKTDEAIRIRQVGDDNRITYKGPKIDQATKTRREIELPLGTGQEQTDQWDALLRAVGFEPVTAVRKSRIRGRLTWQGSDVELAMDEVDDVGHYIELELIAQTRDQLADAQEKILTLCSRLRLKDAERRSYLELLLSKKR